MADLLDTEFKRAVLKVLKQLKEDVEKIRKQCINRMEISVKRYKT